MERSIKKSDSIKDIAEVFCPTCRMGVTWDKSSLYRPFCSIRCKQIDFFEWATEGFKIPYKENNTNLGNSEKEKNEDNQYQDL
jgi:endogenous inhibitor of DNA gyrase (YacG/DUF329 family)